MKFLIVGATGSVGKHLVNLALEAGHSVAALTRDPEGADFEPHERLTVTAGDPMKPASVGSAMAGQDAVFVTLGGGLVDNVRSEGTDNVIAAMSEAGVKRLICQTTLGVGDSRPLLDLKWKLLFGSLLRFAYNDHAKQEDIVRDSELDWTLVRPAAFTDGPMTGSYRHGFDADASRLQLEISRGDVAHFMLQQAESDDNIGKACGLSY